MTQKEQVQNFCEKQNYLFTLTEVYEALPHIPQPSIRQLLQALRDKGIIRFVDYFGTYALV